MSIIIARNSVLKEAKGNAHSLSLDLYAEWRHMEKSGQWRFTPPTAVVAALDKALEAHEAEGGSTARLARYRSNWRAQIDAMRDLGFVPMVPEERQSPIIVNYHQPADPNFRIQDFVAAMRERGYVIYPASLTKVPAFRVGCIGAIGVEEMRQVVATIGQVTREMGVTHFGPTI
jgi:2-aminoethylphosphonate-pyruvate transaminase